MIKLILTCLNWNESLPRKCSSVSFSTLSFLKVWIFTRLALFQHNCIFTWIISFIGATRTVHTCRTAVLQAVLSFLNSLFASKDPQRYKILQFYYFQTLLGKKVRGGWGEGGGCEGDMAPTGRPGFAAPV